MSEITLIENIEIIETRFGPVLVERIGEGFFTAVSVGGILRAGRTLESAVNSLVRTLNTIQRFV